MYILFEERFRLAPAYFTAKRWEPKTIDVYMNVGSLRLLA